MHTLAPTHLRLLASVRTWIDPEALRQFCACAELEGVRWAVALPDLEPGPASPSGAAFVSEDCIHPGLIGPDIGCGLSLFKTDLSVRRACPDAWAEVRFDLEHHWEGDVRGRLVREELCATQFADSFGTLGEGQHFAELQAVEQVFQPGPLRRLGLSREQLVLLVHAGSGDCGRSVLENHQENATGTGTGTGTGSGAEPMAGAGSRYRLLHDHALRWARANRAVLAERFLGTLGASGRRVLDVCHNSITPVPRTGTRRRGSSRPGKGQDEHGPGTGNRTASQWLHRCGAAPADEGPIVIPGNRGAFSYLVQPITSGPAQAWSLAHGAGRRWTRSAARARVRERFDAAHLVRTGLDGRVVCEDRHRLYEDAPAAYKDVEAVVSDLVEAGLIEILATLRPVLTYQTRNARR